MRKERCLVVCSEISFGERERQAIEHNFDTVNVPSFAKIKSQAKLLCRNLDLHTLAKKRAEKERCICLEVFLRQIRIKATCSSFQRKVGGMSRLAFVDLFACNVRG